jgi:DNA-binding transcriptional regulator YiaG
MVIPEMKADTIWPLTGYIKLPMPNIATVLKSEISRLARREIRGESQRLKKQVAHHRAELAALAKRLNELEKQLRRQSKATKVATAAEEGSLGKALRFSARGLAKQRQRLGLSAREVGELLGVSALSIYKWETGKVRPRARQLEAIASLRSLGKREASTRLEAVAR